MGSRLPSEEEVLIIPPTGKKGRASCVSASHPLSPGALPGSAAFRSRIREQSGPDGMQSLLRCREHDSQKSYFPKVQGALLMKKILLTVVLGIAAGAWGQTASQPAQGQPAASPAAGPVIKDPAEYNAYVAASGQKDPSAQISGFEAFLTQYPNSIMKNQA